MTGLLRFLGAQLFRKELWLLLLANFTAALMIAWRGKLQGDIFRGIDNK